MTELEIYKERVAALNTEGTYLWSSYNIFMVANITLLGLIFNRVVSSDSGVVVGVGGVTLSIIGLVIGVIWYFSILKKLKTFSFRLILAKKVEPVGMDISSWAS